MMFYEFDLLKLASKNCIYSLEFPKRVNYYLLLAQIMNMHGLSFCEFPMTIPTVNLHDCKLLKIISTCDAQDLMTTCPCTVTDHTIPLQQ